MVSMTWQGNVVLIVLAILFITTTAAKPITSPRPPPELRTNHLFYEHVDPLIYQLSQLISTTFRTSMTLRVIPDYDSFDSTMTLDSNEAYQDVIPVDLDLLLGQLQGAVGSFVEDKLPGIWSRQLNQNDTTIQTRLEALSTRCRNSECPTTEIDVIQHELTPAWLHILHTDLPILFRAAQIQVHGVLALFDPPPRHTYQVIWQWQGMADQLTEHWTTLTKSHFAHPLRQQAPFVS